MVKTHIEYSWEVEILIEETAFDDFLDSEECDRIFDELQLVIKNAYLAGYKKREESIIIE